MRILLAPRAHNNNDNRIDAPQEYIVDVLKRVRGEYLQRTYDLDPEDLSSPEAYVSFVSLDFRLPRRLTP